MGNFFVGIDFGGTFIKGGIIDKEGNLIVKNSVPTESDRGPKYVIQKIADLIENLIVTANIERGNIGGIGIGIPGYIDTENGVVVVSGNINWHNIKIVEELKKRISDIPIKIANDANVAALGEAKFGSAKNYKYCVFITLGTGVGSGIIIDGKIYYGNQSAGAELGHMIIHENGEQCTCGNKGCFETYASATALIRETKRAMSGNLSSKLWEVGGLDKVDGKTAFDYYDIDIDAKRVVDTYINNLALGLVNIANILRPEVIIIGGGVANQGKSLIDPLNKKVAEKIYAGSFGPKVPVIKATLSEAGVCGAAALNM